MSQKSILLSFAISVIANSLNVSAKSINTEGENANDNQSIFKLPVVLCIVGVVVIVATGGFCLFSSKKKNKNLSEEYLKKESSNTSSSSSSSSSNTSISENRQLNKEIEEGDITVEIDKMNDADKIEKNNEPKRRSVLDSILNRNPTKEKRKSFIQFKDDRSLNSISTNEDWINEQKLQAEYRNEQDGLYEDEDVDSNDGFWNGNDLQPVQSSTDNKQNSYGVPSLGKRNSVIVKGSGPKIKRQSVIIVDDGSEDFSKSVSELEKSSELKPTRVKSWKNSDFNEEIEEILRKNLNEEEIV